MKYRVDDGGKTLLWEGARKQCNAIIPLCKLTCVCYYVLIVIMCYNIMQFPSNYVICVTCLSINTTVIRNNFLLFFCLTPVSHGTLIPWLHLYQVLDKALSQVCIQPHFVFVSLKTYRRSNVKHQL